MSLTSPPALKAGSKIGIATPSWPANHYFKEKFEYGVNNLKKMGFQVRLGALTKTFASEGYRAGKPEARAAELMELFEDASVNAIICTIGGSCSVSVSEYLDYPTITKNPKVFCGYSDITALHLALMVKANLRTFYGPAVVPSFGEHPDMLPFSKQSFLDATVHHLKGERRLQAPTQWSNQLRDASNEEWKTGVREFKPNDGWKVLRHGRVEGPIYALNLNTFSNLIGTDLQPNLRGSILILEEMVSSLELQERKLWQLRRAGIFDQLGGLIISKPDSFDACGASFTYEELLMEVVGKFKFPVATEFDCGHTYPMITIPQGVNSRLDCSGAVPHVSLLEGGVTK